MYVSRQVYMLLQYFHILFIVENIVIFYFNNVFFFFYMNKLQFFERIYGNGL